MRFTKASINHIKQVLILMVLLSPCSAMAAQMGGNPWETIGSKIAMSITGPVAYSAAIIAIVMCGLTMAFVDLQGGFKRFVQVALGFSIAFFAAQIASSFLGFSGAII